MATPIPFNGLEDLREHLNKANITAELAELEMHLEAATGAVEGWHAIGPLVTREFTERAESDCGLMVLTKTPLQSVTSATTVPDGATVDTSAWVPDKLTGMVTRVPSGTYDNTYQAGRGTVAEVPTELKLAVLIIADHLWAAQRGPTQSRNFAGHADSDEGGSMHRVSTGYLIPNRAAHLMQPYASVLVG